MTAVVFVLFIPGNALVQLAFARRYIGHSEQIVLSVGLSMAIVSLVGLLLKYSPLGLTAGSAVICIGVLSIALLITAKYRHFLHKRREYLVQV